MNKMLAQLSRFVIVLFVPVWVWFATILYPGDFVAHAAPLTPDLIQYQADQYEAHQNDRPISIGTPKTTTGAESAADDLIPTSSQSYKGQKTNSQHEVDNVVKSAQEKLGNFGETVVEKLNLKEPLPDSTKGFIEQVKDTLD
ncbi:MAG: hypothetical protein SFW36_20615 [Leptolyngbyaceae cyanobacterium bins.59]|nr:hypothetical protein [Leptolyngbyaceae cyanobacterium bins.59]